MRIVLHIMMITPILVTMTGSLRIMMFHTARDVVGAEVIDLPCAAALSQDALWDRLLAIHPGLGVYRPCIRLACNGSYVLPDTLFQPGDEVALIPPVSGG